MSHSAGEMGSITHELPGAAMARPRSLGWPVFLSWCTLYLLLMAHGGWRWQGAGILGFGMPATASLQDFGAAVPTRVRGGEWWRLLLSPWLHHSLLGLLLLGLFWSSTARTLVSIAGTARTWILFVGGGVCGALAHTMAHPELATAGGAGPFDAIAAGVGAQLAWGLRSRSAQAPRVRNGAIVSILIVGLLTWYFTKDSDRGAGVRALVGFEAMVGGCLAGIVLMALMGPRRIAQSAGSITRAVAFLLFLLVAWAVVEQAPRAVASGQRGEVRAFLKTLKRAELSASRLRDQREATDAKRDTLYGRLERVLADRFLDEYAGAESVRTYVEAMRAYTKPVRLPYLARDPCRTAFREMYETYELPLRKEVGLRARYPSEKYWERD